MRQWQLHRIRVRRYLIPASCERTKQASPAVPISRICSAMLLAFGGRHADHSWVSLTSSRSATWPVRTAISLLDVQGRPIKVSGLPATAGVVGRKRYIRDRLPKMAGQLLFGMTARWSHRLQSKQHYMKDVTLYSLGATCRSLNGSRISPLTSAP